MSEDVRLLSFRSLLKVFNLVYGRHNKKHFIEVEIFYLLYLEKLAVYPFKSLGHGRFMKIQKQTEFKKWHLNHCVVNSHQPCRERPLQRRHCSLLAVISSAVLTKYLTKVIIYWSTTLYSETWSNHVSLRLTWRNESVQIDLIFPGNFAPGTSGAGQKAEGLRIGNNQDHTSAAFRWQPFIHCIIYYISQWNMN